MFPVSLECPFLIAPSIFSNVSFSDSAFLNNCDRREDHAFFQFVSVLNASYRTKSSALSN